MIHLIDKSALVAEIERRNEILVDKMNRLYYASNYNEWEVVVKEYRSLISFINTLEVKEEFKIGETQIYLEDDGGEPPYDGKQWLDLSCTEYEIPEDIFKDGDDVEIIIRKKKGENYGYSH